MKLQLDDGFGFAEVEVRGGAAAKLDLWESYNAYVSLKAAHPGDGVALGAAWCDWLAGKGLPGLSHGAGFRVFDHIAAAMAELKKKETPPPSPSADSAGSTGSAPSA